MTEKERLIDFLSGSLNGLITTKEITVSGFHRETINQLVKDGILVRQSRGVYKLPSLDADMLFLLQTKYPKGIYSEETALFLHGYVNELSETFCMTFPNGYHAKKLKEKPVRIKHCIPELYMEGIVNVNTSYGNPVIVYCIERTICDMLRGSNNDKSTVSHIIKKYISSEKKDVSKLLYYADITKVRTKIQKYLDFFN